MNLGWILTEQTFPQKLFCALPGKSASAMACQALTTAMGAERLGAFVLTSRARVRTSFTIHGILSGLLQADGPRRMGPSSKRRTGPRRPDAVAVRGPPPKTDRPPAEISEFIHGILLGLVSTFSVSSSGNFSENCPRSFPAEPNRKLCDTDFLPCWLVLIVRSAQSATQWKVEKEEICIPNG